MESEEKALLDSNYQETTAFPGDESYSPIVQLNFVEWHDNAIPRELKSVKEILSAQTNGELTVTKTTILINSPVVQR